MVDSAEMNNVNLIKVKEGGIDRGGWSRMWWMETTERAKKKSDHSVRRRRAGGGLDAEPEAVKWPLRRRLLGEDGGR
ncbi:hypothetical protein F444_15195 [Phytophthora nicotianae P1976]|uniref:Uncharacterized protein n=1 Tax=Phytophthora nicotianae P1976 TaxID=1317066 RepID=A0A080ZMR6_PHYNI|nr:hypothetical protein F444_15195 [Phytophthora nicotianae P1976]